MLMRRILLIWPFVALPILSGCEKAAVEFLETKNVEERLSEKEIAAIVAVLETVGENEKAKLPFPFLPPPAWSQSRTLPVSELISAEEDSLNRVWSSEDAATRIPKGEPWDSALKTQRLTREQFCALVLNLAAALARSSTDRTISLKQLAERGDRELASLANDERPFSSLTSDERHHALNQAIWLTIRDRAEKLALVPTENVEAVAAAGPALRKSLGEIYFRDPFRDLYPRPEDAGVPFQEGELSDADLTWSPSNTIIGSGASTEPLSSLKALDRR